MSGSTIANKWINKWMNEWAMDYRRNVIKILYSLKWILIFEFKFSDIFPNSNPPCHNILWIQSRFLSVIYWLCLPNGPTVDILYLWEGLNMAFRLFLYQETKIMHLKQKTKVLLMFLNRLFKFLSSGDELLYLGLLVFNPKS